MLSSYLQIHFLEVALVEKPQSDAIRRARDQAAVQFLAEFPTAKIIVVLNTHSAPDGTVIYWDIQGGGNPRSAPVALVSFYNSVFAHSLTLYRFWKSAFPPDCGNSYGQSPVSLTLTDRI